MIKITKKENKFLNIKTCLLTEVCKITKFNSDKEHNHQYNKSYINSSNSNNHINNNSNNNNNNSNNNINSNNSNNGIIYSPNRYESTLRQKKIIKQSKIIIFFMKINRIMVYGSIINVIKAALFSTTSS